MAQFKNLTILGTSHIAKQSIQEVKKAIEDLQPGIVAVELDKRRLAALLEKKKEGVSLRDIWRIGFKGYLFSLVGAYVEKKLGEQVGVSPGEEMLTAVKLAKKKNITLALIDQDIEITLKRFSKAITWKEKLFFVWEIVKSPFQKKQRISFDLSSVPSKELIRTLTGKVKKDYPSVYRVLIEERNVFMAKKLAELLRTNTEIPVLAILGAGHEEEIIEMVKKDLSTLTFSYSFPYEED